MNLPLSCRCGAIKGTIAQASPRSGNRVVCCCSDCQAFANHVSTTNDTLDAFGGTEIYQTALSRVSISAGSEHLNCVRLTPKGLYRWYASCCQTPVANTIGAGFPFIGIIHTFFDTEDRQQQLGPVLAYAQVQHARGEPDYPHSARKFPVGITFRIVRQMLTWKLKGLNKPSEFYDESGKPVSKPTVLNPAAS